MREIKYFLKDVGRVLLVFLAVIFLPVLPFLLMAEDRYHRRKNLRREEESLGPDKPCPDCGIYNRDHFDFDADHRHGCDYWDEEEAA